MPGQPLAYLRMLVSCVVVDDGVDLLSRWHLRLDGVEETDELLVPVALHIAADDGAVEDVEGREQCRRAMTLVVVGHRPGATLLHWQAGLGAVERLDLTLFIDREDDGMGGRIDIETDDVAQLVDEARVGGEFELFHPVRLQAVRAPDALDGTRADANDLRHHRGGPVGRLGWRGSPAHDLIGTNTVRAQQDDLSPPDMLVRGVAVRASAFRRRRSAGLRVMEIPVRMRQTPPGEDSNVRRNPLGNE